eukprot:CAMPEP_0114350164 /NCGR_PEP_ID=MMETSP0101-20121206/16128_1 /TAXON_ID=38822 ORGANISM="Pteridomonas danica, Strain PT" /NCGR_SAMPLE_ID=MMETSP0101 /ASSEMBLY_ACC=CAM_ASM_000211 /LENGTH=115 /DNA_ID=CAMNT_0001489203 /DNA_START=110 /DNA_END=457 /DNA_ORIENTATION=-
MKKNDKEMKEESENIKESDYLKQYYFNEIGRLEQDLRLARTTSSLSHSSGSGGGLSNGVGGMAHQNSGSKSNNMAAILTPLSVTERNTLREQALLATKERKADLQRLKEIGIGIF